MSKKYWLHPRTIFIVYEYESHDISVDGRKNLEIFNGRSTFCRSRRFYTPRHHDNRRFFPLQKLCVVIVYEKTGFVSGDSTIYAD